jgi:hypothetical protein
MQIIKTLGWVFLTALVMAFVMLNYGEKHDVIIWPTANDALVFNWPVGIIALVFWLLGVIPVMLYHRGVRWSLERRIRSLENSIKSSALARRHDQAADNPVEKPADNPAQSADTAPNLAKSSSDTGL